MENFDRVVSDPLIMQGQPCIRGTRITVSNIVRQVAAGREMRAILEDYPMLDEASLRAALEFAASACAFQEFTVKTS